MTEEALRGLLTTACEHPLSMTLLGVLLPLAAERDSLLVERDDLLKDKQETLEILHDLKEDHPAYAVTIKHYPVYEPIHGIYTSSSLSEIKMWTQKEFDEYHLKFGHNMFAEVYCGEEVILIGERIEDELVWRTPNQLNEER